MTAVMTVLTLGLSYKEDISDFLPFDTQGREALEVYQDISGADRLIVIAEGKRDEPEKLVEAMETFTSSLPKSIDVTARMDMDEIAGVQRFVYDNIPYFLDHDDYVGMDSMLSQPDFITNQLREARQMLMLPTGGLLSGNMSRDPLNLFTPVVSEMAQGQMLTHFETYEGYIFTPDMTRAVALITSPYGNAETARNSGLMDTLRMAIEAAAVTVPDVKMHVTGGPAIAVGNAEQIRSDAMMAIAVSSLLIAALLLYYLRLLRRILLIVLAIAWGWLFAMGGMALVHNEVSIIVLGLASVIIGIAVNYPLHMVVHTRNGMSMREALQDIAKPLLIGNITTVGAFMALIPLNASALRDLGLFASFLLVGTICFVLIWLPQIMPTRLTAVSSGSGFGGRRILERFPKGTMGLVGVLVITSVLGYYSLGVEFDTDMAHLNYMTDAQRRDMEYLDSLLKKNKRANAGTQTLYVVSSAKTIDEALDKHAEKKRAIESQEKGKKHSPVFRFLPSQREQQRRIDMWRQFVSRHQQQFCDELPHVASRLGFRPEAFQEFSHIINREYETRDFQYFKPLTATVLAGNISINPKHSRYSVIDRVEVRSDRIDNAERAISGSFSVKSMNNALASTLADNFNYIGIVCSAVVFLFLWLSFRSFKLAIISFLPMVISWIWILGIMALLGIKFNLVNIILATFIFGQGDDYTIFITEGCHRESYTGKAVLSEYTGSIMLSAAIMFIGIGSLIFAKHPALHSLAEVTIIGMGCVVLMARVIPPMIYNVIMKKKPIKE